MWRTVTRCVPRRQCTVRWCSQSKCTSSPPNSPSPCESGSAADDRRVQPKVPSSRVVLRSDAARRSESAAAESSDVQPLSSSSSPNLGTTACGNPVDYAARFSVVDTGPVRPTGLWKVDEVMNKQNKTVEFRKIDDIESDIMEDLAGRGDALVPFDDEARWKHRLMFECKFKNTPKHLTWKELGQEIDCIDCTFDPDPHRPEEIFTVKFFFVNRKKGTRDEIFSARNDVSISEGFTDMMAAIGSCLGRADVFRTIRFDDGVGTHRDVCFRKKSRFTSEIQISFRPAVTYNVYERKEQTDEWESSMAKEGMSTWGFHPQLMDREYQEEFDDPEGTYTISLSSHAFAYVFLRGVERLLNRPMKDFYRHSQLLKTVKAAKEDDIGLAYAVKGWLGVDEQIYPHYTSIEAIQHHWLGSDAPFTLVAIVNKLREMAYLKKKNPEFHAWLGVRKRDTSLAIRNISVKLLGAGASTLFVPVGHSATVNRLLPKSQQRRLESRVSINSVLGMPDESRNIAEFKKITGFDRITSGGGISSGSAGGAVAGQSESAPAAVDETKPPSPLTHK